jgi:hypothetical protein
VRQVDFNDLPRASRELFVRALVTSSPTAAPICRRRVRQRSALPWYFLLVLGFSALGAIASYRFGWPTAPLQDRRFLGGYIGLFALVSLAISMLARRRAIEGSLPFAPGVYVFPLEVVDARTRELALYPLAEATSTEIAQQKRGRFALWIMFQTESFSFEIKGQHRAESALARVHEARGEIAASALRGEPSPEIFDPFAEARARNFEPVAEHGLLARGRPSWTRFIWAIAIIFGLTLGTAGWRLRNWRSDARVFAKIKSGGDVALGEAYVRAGGLKAAEVNDFVVPRARLAAAKKEPARAEAIAKFLATYPGSKVEGEAKAALAEALHADFAELHTVSGLRAFISRWPDAADVPSAKTKIEALQRKAVADLHSKANPADKNVIPVIEAVLRMTQSIEVRFHKRETTSLASAEALLAKGLLDDDGTAQGGNVPASAILADDVRRETTIMTGLQRAFAVVFPEDVVTFRREGPAAGGPTAGVAPGRGPAAGGPTAGVAPRRGPAEGEAYIQLDVELGWSGATLLSRETKRRYLGFLLKLEGTIHPAKDGKKLSFSARLETPDSVQIEGDDPSSAYFALLERTLDGLGERLRAVLFTTTRASSSR